MQTVYIVVKGQSVLGVYMNREKADLVAAATDARVTCEPVLK